MELLMLVIGLVALDLLAMRFGADSRDISTNRAQGGGAAGMRGADHTLDQELAREIAEARRRRLADSRDVNARLQPPNAELAQAA